MHCLKANVCGVVTNITPQTFKYYSFAGIEIISGEEYYINKAISLGALYTKPIEKVKKTVKRPVKKKSKSK